MERIKNILLYAGLEKDSDAKYKEHVLKQDVNNLTYYLLVAGLLFLILGITSVVSSGFARNNTVLYFLTALFFGVLLVLLRLTIKFRGISSEINRIYIYSFMMVLYIEAIMLTIMHPDQPAVTYIGVLLILPLLFAQYPLPMIIFQGCFVALFCVFASYYKTPEVAAIDVWNGISFYAVSVFEIILVIPMRFNQIIQPEIIKELSEKDMLTGLKNRNSFELYCKEKHSDMTGLACVYADANGLHEINNKYGHEAGDNMLKAVAVVMMKHFGNESVYRIGGDEFVAFTYQFERNQMNSHVLEINNELMQMGYHLSIGYAICEGNCHELDELIKKAEVNMYDDKRTYYSNSQNNRRSR